MALIECKECGHMISDRANKCPKCGCPRGVEAAQEEPDIIVGPKKKNTWIWALCTLLLCLIGGGMIMIFCLAIDAYT